MDNGNNKSIKVVRVCHFWHRACSPLCIASGPSITNNTMNEKVHDHKIHIGSEETKFFPKMVIKKNISLFSSLSVSFWCACVTCLGVHSTITNRLLHELFNTGNSSYRAHLDKFALPKKRSFEIVLEHGTRAQVQLMLPPSWRAELRDAAFPVLVEV